MIWNSPVSGRCQPAGTLDKNPVGGATGVQYTRRSADGKILHRELTGIRDREVNFGLFLCALPSLVRRSILSPADR